jgi:hypothetical protein
MSRDTRERARMRAATAETESPPPAPDPVPSGPPTAPETPAQLARLADFIEAADELFVARPELEPLGRAFFERPSVEGARALLDVLEGAPGMLEAGEVESAAAYVAAIGECILTASMQKQADARASKGDLE